MLARVAERVYWSARYLERVENTARLINVYTNLLLDIPKGVDLSWYNLIVISGSAKEFSQHYTSPSEDNVIYFLVADTNNPSSLLSSLINVRENFRTSRDVVPSDAWELINELHLYVNDNLKSGLARVLRHEFMNTIVLACQQINGMFMGEMPRNSVWNFLRMGRNLERADMSTRLLDVGAAAIIAGSSAPNFNQVVWGNVLVSASALQSYLHQTGSTVSGDNVARYLLFDVTFPRSFAYCFNTLMYSAHSQPRHQALQETIESLKKKLDYESDFSLSGESFRDYLNDLQLDIGQLHHDISNNWFAA